MSNLEATIFQHWRAGRDTVDIGKVVNLPEHQVERWLWRILEERRKKQ